MPTTFHLPDKTTLTSIDRANDSFLVYDDSATALKKTSVNYALDLTSHPVGIDDVQTLTNKTVTAPTISGPTLSGTIVGTYTLGGTPTFPASVVTTTGSQTLTNKTLTSPTINTATISNPTLTTDTVSEYTGANGVTVDGLNIKDSKLNTNNSVVTANITDAAVTTAKVTASGTGLTHSTTQSIANTTVQAVVFDTEAFDTDAYHSTSSNTSRITVPTAGKYLFVTNVTFASNATGLRFVFFCKNGVTTGRYGGLGVPPQNGDTTNFSTSYIFNLSANDYIEVYVYQSSGGALNLVGDATAPGNTSFEVARLGA